jgi:enoyl-CoA hydratase/carnithine racemase
MSAHDSRPAAETLKDLEALRYSQDDAGIGVLALSRPPVNALGRQVVADLRTALTALAADSSVRALVLTGAGRTFSAGADLKERQSMSEDEVRAFVRSLSDTFQKVAELPMPTVAAINGTAAGGGCELALACDFRILDSAGRVGLPETTLAIVPGAGGTQRLPRLIGPARAKRWIFSGRLFTADEALADGVADRIVPTDKVRDAAVEMVTEMARSGPLAVRAAKVAVDAALNVSLAEGLEIEWEAYEQILDTEDRLEALAAFQEKRKPVFKGR